MQSDCGRLLYLVARYRNRTYGRLIKSCRCQTLRPTGKGIIGAQDSWPSLEVITEWHLLVVSSSTEPPFPLILKRGEGGTLVQVIGIFQSHVMENQFTRSTHSAKMVIGA